MRLVFVHYHLNRGGVTSVIRSHLQSLSQVGSQDPQSRIEEAFIAYGGRAEDWNRDFESQLGFPVSHWVLPELEYSDRLNADSDPFESLQQSLIKNGCTPESTVLHVHNHALGKNVKLPATLKQLATEGWRILLQMHDFAEDLRPQNYALLLREYGSHVPLCETLYPQASQFRYATLNQADRVALIGSGWSEAEVALLPNPVENAATDATSKTNARRRLFEVYGVDEDSTYILYPVRGIRRKNLGELLLWSMLFDDCTFSVTLEPRNEKERKSYLLWQQLAESLSLPIVFGSGEKMSLDENYAAADAVISTSVAEGFGLVFLEASLRDRPLFGRNLPGVTNDFIANGMRFPGLADELLVPTSAFDLNSLKETYASLLRTNRTDYGLDAIDEEELCQSIESLSTDVIDFGRLGSKQQQEALTQLHSDATLRSQIRSLNPCITVAESSLRGETTVLQEAAAANRSVIQEHYSAETTGRKLVSIYNSLLNSEPTMVETSSGRGQRLLNRFVGYENLKPVRIES